MQGRNVETDEEKDAVLSNANGLTNRQNYDSTSAPHDSSPTGTDELTVDKAVDTIGFGWFQVKLTFVIALGWMSDAMEMMVLSILGPAVHCQWMVPTWQQALLTSIVLAGMLLSSPLWGKFADKYGRRAELFLSSICVFYFGILSALSPNYLWMLLLRFLVGTGIGGAPQLLTFYAEFLPSSTRALCMILVIISWAIGASFVVAVSIFIMPTVGWRYLLVIVAIPSLIMFGTCFWLPESPRFNIARGLPDRAMATLERVARANGKPMPRGKLADVVAEADGPVKRGRLRDMFVPELRVTTILLWLIWFADGLVYYGVILTTTELMQLNDVCFGGANTETTVEAVCRLECKYLSMKDYVELLLTTVSEIPGLLVTSFLVEFIGRRFTMSLEFFVFAVFMLLLNFCVKRTAMLVFLFIARAVAIGTFQANFVYTPEVYPTTIRALSLGICNAMSRFGAIITPFISQVLMAVKVHVALAFYVVVAVVAGTAVLLLPIETKGRAMKDTHLAMSSSRRPITTESTSTH